LIQISRVIIYSSAVPVVAVDGRSLFAVDSDA